MDYYHKKLNHFSWTWLEHKRCPFHKAHRKERVATRLARAHARRETRLEIEASR